MSPGLLPPDPDDEDFDQEMVAWPIERAYARRLAYEKAEDRRRLRELAEAGQRQDVAHRPGCPPGLALTFERLPERPGGPWLGLLECPICLASGFIRETQEQIEASAARLAELLTEDTLPGTSGSPAAPRKRGGGPPAGLGLTVDRLVEAAKRRGRPPGEPPTQAAVAEEVGMSVARVQQVTSTAGGWPEVLRAAGYDVR